MTYSESAALKALSEIRDPRTGRDIVSAGMLGDLVFDDGTLRAVIMIDPALASGFEPVRKSAEDTLSLLEGVKKASVILTAHKAAPKVGASAKPKRSPNPHQARRLKAIKATEKPTQFWPSVPPKAGLVNRP